MIFTNIALLLITYLLERVYLLRHESRKVIEYENIDLIKTENRLELINDLEERTGLKINRVEIGKIDFLRDSARVYLYYFESDNQPNFADDDRVEGDNGR